MKRLTILLSFVLTLNLLAQIAEITKFPLQDSTQNQHYSSIVETANGGLLFFWIESTELKMSKSSNGVTWGDAQVLITGLATDESQLDLTTYKLSNGEIYVAYMANIGIAEYHLITSTTNGETWNAPIVLITDPNNASQKGWNAKFSQTDDNKLWFTFNKRVPYFEYISLNSVGEWSEIGSFGVFLSNASIFDNSSNLSMICSKRSNVLLKHSNDGGETWDNGTTIVSGYDPSVVKKSNGDLLLIYKDNTEPLESSIFYVESTDEGNSWSAPSPFTKFDGNNLMLDINTNSKNLFASFVSNRSYDESYNEIYSLWYGNIGLSDDTYTPPKIMNISNLPELPTYNDTVTITATVFDDESVSKVYFNSTINGIEQTPIRMYDDGSHNDVMANDSIYGVVHINNYSITDGGNYSISAYDNKNNKTEKYGSVLITNPYSSDNYYMEVNRFKLPIDNKGFLANVDVEPYGPGGIFDGGSVLYSGGFGLSGYSNGELWANAVLSASRIEDYQPGIFGSSKSDPHNVVYVLKSTDEPFGLTWELWGNAVKQGAKFYDGNKDGVYNPLDLNSNGIWDTNEDRPDLIGDITAWTVFNDAVPYELRRFSVSPKDIEIKQTVFGYSKNSNADLDGVVFIRYIIENKSYNTYNSVYFSALADPDLGDYQDDLVGCDISLNSGYTYDNGNDAVFGNSPAFITTILQGAPVYIAGETFTDNNGNNIFDMGIDTALDTAFNFNGEYIHEKHFIGAKNIGVTSHTQFMQSHPTHGDPDTHHELRNYMIGGHGKAGDSVYVSTWRFGNGNELGVDTLMPAHFMYSGNPVSQTGWLNNVGIDQRNMLNSGPFTLEPNKPIEIIVAFVVGRGNTSLESVDVTKEIAKNTIEFYNSSFRSYVVGVHENPQNQQPTDYSLSQNYPNPFNPSTTIQYSIPVGVEALRATSVQLKIYDILGREIATFVNKQQKAGNYEVVFNANNLTSGIYFYRLQSGSFIETKKLILLK